MVIYCCLCDEPFYEDKNNSGNICPDCKEEILLEKGKKLIEGDD